MRAAGRCRHEPARTARRPPTPADGGAHEGACTRPTGGGSRWCAARFNDDIVDKLIDGARQALREAGAADGDVELFRCPGAMELPGLARRVAETGRFDGVVCLGAVIRGGTPHFDLVAGEAARGIGALAAEGRLPVAFGVLACDTLEQALERAAPRRRRTGASTPPWWWSRWPTSTPGSAGRGRVGRLLPRRVEAMAGTTAQIARDRAADPSSDRRGRRSRTPTHRGAAVLRAPVARRAARRRRGRRAGPGDARRRTTPAGDDRIDRPLVGRAGPRRLEPSRRDRRAAHRLSRNWRLERMAVVERNVIRIALYELQHSPTRADERRPQRGRRAGQALRHGGRGGVRQRPARPRRTERVRASSEPRGRVARERAPAASPYARGSSRPTGFDRRVPAGEARYARGVEAPDPQGSSNPPRRAPAGAARLRSAFP